MELNFFFQVMQGLAKAIAWDGEGATCLIEGCALRARGADQHKVLYETVHREICLILGLRCILHNPADWHDHG